MAKKYCRKFQPLSRLHERYEQQTDLRQQRPEHNVTTFGKNLCAIPSDGNDDDDDDDDDDSNSSRTTIDIL